MSFAPPARDKRGMRTGFTTGSCAAAAAAAAARSLAEGREPASVEIALPVGGTATFAPTAWAHGEDWSECGVVKDAGDDPDATHGALVVARVERTATGTLEIAGGEGVGVVTLPGLGLDVGGPAINAVPRTMIAGEVTAAAPELAASGVRVTISVPDGERIARRTLNERLGIVGGISILGTWGIVRPYSTASWRASVVQAVDVAAANGTGPVALCTGSRSERFAMVLYPELPPVRFVEMGIFTGDALRACARNAIPSVAVCGMIGKFAKLAQGHMQTHVAGNQVDTAFLADVAASCDASAEIVAAVAVANTGRHVAELVAGTPAAAPFFGDLARRTAQRCRAHTAGAVPVDAVLFDFDGAVLGRAAA